jgi:hypothetical protein
MPAMATMPPAPARFSITTVWPSRFSRPGCSSLPTTSVLPPGGKLTTIRIGRSGHAPCAAAVPTNPMEIMITMAAVRTNNVITL